MPPCWKLRVEGGFEAGEFGFLARGHSLEPTGEGHIFEWRGRRNSRIGAGRVQSNAYRYK